MSSRTDACLKLKNDGCTLKGRLPTERRQALIDLAGTVSQIPGPGDLTRLNPGIRDWSFLRESPILS